MSARPPVAVLVVEDERIVARDLQMTLADMGYDAWAVAASSEEALARAAEKRPDVVLMDIRIKGAVDGIQTAALLADRCAPIVIYLSAHADEATLQKAQKTVPYGYLIKPVKPAELRSTIEIALHRRETEEARDLAARLEREKRELEASELRLRHGFEQQIAGIVSHDLRSPLSSILLSSEGLLRSKTLGERERKLAARINDSADRSLRLVADLLDFTRVRLGGALRIEPRPARLSEVAKKAIDELTAAHPDRTIELRGDDGEGLWDVDRLAQLLSNLVSNALHYSLAGTPVEVRLLDSPASIALCVHNQGEPIPAARMGALFEPLHRGESTVDRNHRGLGLGLYIVEAVAKAHGGSVGVVSTAEAGTTFTVTLPRPPATAATPP